MGFKAGDKVRLKYKHAEDENSVVTLIGPKETATGGAIPKAWVWASDTSESYFGSAPWDYEDDFEYPAAEPTPEPVRQDWTGLCDHADEFIAALNTTGQYILAGIIADLKNALIEESYR